MYALVSCVGVFFSINSITLQIDISRGCICHAKLLSPALQGSLPDSLFTLGSLQRLEMSDNWISTAIPATFG